MMLLVDAGNTRVKWALADPMRPPGAWVSAGAQAHAELDALGASWSELASSQEIASVHVANVAGQSMRDRLQALLRQAVGGSVPIHWFASQPALSGIRNCYPDHRQLGCDRFASVIGAHALFPGQALLVVTCGTATTLDAVTADGGFAGGMILPGLGLMAHSLARNTAQLPQIATGHQSALFANNTDDAIGSGCLAAQAGAIEHACRALARQLRLDKVQCVLSGGAASYIEPHLDIEYHWVENLVLIGLYTAATWPGGYPA